MTPSDSDHSDDKEAPFRIRFWGVRGSVPTPQPDRLRYGGNTACVEMLCGAKRLIFDAGTGLAQLGQELLAEGPVVLDLFLSHTHLDHINGLPFFAPIYNPDNEISLWAGHLGPEENLMQVLRRIMSSPIMPVPLEAMQAARRFIQFVAGNPLDPQPGVVMRTHMLNHPDNAVGYRVEFGGRDACYITDFEHDDPGANARLVDFVRGAQVMIYDATYTDEDYANGKQGWGHSTWQRALEIADRAEIDTCVLFHHAPEYDDDKLDEIAAAVDAQRPGTLVAREGVVLTLQQRQIIMDDSAAFIPAGQGGKV